MSCERAGCACRVKPAHVPLSAEMFGDNGNAWALLAHVDSGMRRAGATRAQRDRFREDAQSGDYDHLLRVCLAYTEPATVKKIVNYVADMAEIEEKYGSERDMEFEAD